MDIIDKIKQIEHMNRYGFYIPKFNFRFTKDFFVGEIISIYGDKHEVIENGDTYIKVIKIGGE